MPKLTGYEAMKVIGEAMAELGAKAEAHEEETGEKFEFTTGEIVSTVTGLIVKLGKEVLD